MQDSYPTDNGAKDAPPAPYNPDRGFPRALGKRRGDLQASLEALDAARADNGAKIALLDAKLAQGVAKRAAEAADEAQTLPRGVLEGMAAAGMTPGAIAEVSGVSVGSVARSLSRPDAKERIQAYRERLKHLKMRRMRTLEPLMWDRAEKEVAEGDAKSVDAMMRALAAAEKIQQAAAGEGTKVEHTGLVPAVEINTLIQQLLRD